jgi:hypothetical protein
MLVALWMMPSIKQRKLHRPEERIRLWDCQLLPFEIGSDFIVKSWNGQQPYALAQIEYLLWLAPIANYRYLLDLIDLDVEK